MLSNQEFEERRLLDDEEEKASTSSDSTMGSGCDTVGHFSPSHGIQKAGLWRSCTIIAVALLSHAFIFAMGFKWRQLTMTDGLSPYLKLAYSEPDVLWWNTDYSGVNASEAELNRLWDSTIPWESGIIAISNEEAKSMGLPEAQPFPWDSKHKSIYIINAHHVLHCVRNLYISIHQYRTNQEQTVKYEHILHCLDTLRVETMCTADDTPRYVPLNDAHNGYRPGDGQRRQCRDWSRVEEFVRTHDPCYRYLRPGDPEQSNLERFSFCPPDSEYLPKIRKYYGHADDWVPPPAEGPREIQW